VPLLRLVGRAGLRIVAIGAEQRYVHGGETLFHKNAPADSGYVILEGAFDLITDLDRGVPAWSAGPGTLLAELAMMTETDYGMTAVATTPSTVIRIPRGLFLKMLEGYPDAARRIRDHISQRAAQSDRELLRVHSSMGGHDRGQ
jgi:CRP-like cAMP-binding protein